VTVKTLRKNEATNSRESRWPDTDPRAQESHILERKMIKAP